MNDHLILDKEFEAKQLIYYLFLWRIFTNLLQL